MTPVLAVDRTCVGCNAAEGKYKCPQCYMYTCSLACIKAHKENHPPEAVKPPPPRGTREESQEGPGQDYNSDSLSPELQGLFRDYPNLPRALSTIAAATDPPVDDGNQAHGKNFPNGYHKKKPWNQDVGMQHGLAAYRRALDGPDGEALREYCELVKIQNARNEEARVRREIAQRDAEVIGKLLREERERE